ncbi:hypothetical protein CC78DRAFT_532469 [Lojkania enalia]|uniref:CENP-T/Histone H4 histone fold domain-containing protein n=1 Tax=Lojkania enalia TaxID=147567 RepID=A0A9P4KCY8_9PLEO|nr:hypothetical protein CC78DRAFT_532469 [Didymosphaeria enalia]
MSESARKRPRTSPQNSEGPEGTGNTTLYTSLRQLAGIAPRPTTPFKRASSAGPTPGSRRTPNIVIRTPGTVAQTPRSGARPRQFPARRAAPTTPHAIRALRERANAARTPGAHRRRSGRIQRETPRDILRDLSRVLAPTTRPIKSSPQVQDSRRQSALDLPDVEDDPEPAAPRLSMPLDDMYDDNSFDEAPPRQSLLPEFLDDVDTETIHSLEFGRRALSEDPRMTFAARLSELGLGGEELEIDRTFINRRPTLNPDQILQDTIQEEVDDTTTEIRTLTGQREGRSSEVGLGVFGQTDEPDEPTFRFTIPQRIQAQAQNIAQDGAQFEDDTGQDVESNAAVNEEEEDAIAGFEQDGWESDPHVEDDEDLQAYREEVSAVDRSLQTHSPERPIPAEIRPRRQRKELHISRCGHEYPSFNPTVVKRLANSFAKAQGSKGKIGNDTLDALVKATDFFFEQIGEDLAVYAQHAGRKIIEESDVIALMRRQRKITSNNTIFSLAQKLLPRELLQELRMHPAPKLKGQKRKRMESIEEEAG